MSLIPGGGEYTSGVAFPGGVSTPAVLLIPGGGEYTSGVANSRWG